MTSARRLLVQATWARVVPIAPVAAELFYGRLFELDPSLRSLFHGDLKEQGEKLMTMLGLAVRGLDDVAKLVPALESLGRRPAGYGVVDAHHDTVGSSLLWTLGQGLGDAFTPEVEASWAEVYGVVASVMKGAAAEPQAAVG